ncbi:MAG: tRNA (guanosine(46)-N7)-methyltransferase TrmB [Mycoplasmoidaceae bacterium]|nr:tRNA (guanosine(46)-N7)-methyltransferase TrmB [Mycoplasmoidaceae bacterium]
MGRLRTNTNAPILIKEYKNYQDLSLIKLQKCPVYLEIGCGKGDFLIEQAKRNPINFYLGIEKYSTVILKALKKIQRNQFKLNNLIFSCDDASKIDPKKFKNKFAGLYLNFSDPWPKKRHAKRRLTSPSFLDIYKKILSKGALVEFKTDNLDLYKYTVDVLKQRKDIKILYKTTNLYKNLTNKFNLSNVQTEYEKKFVLLKKPINKIV